MKKIVTLFILFFSLLAVPLKAQYNPYLDKKKKNKPSAVMAKQNKKDMKRQKKAAKKQMKRSKRRLNKR
jgi:hypothetical protein